MVPLSRNATKETSTSTNQESVANHIQKLQLRENNSREYVANMVKTTSKAELAKYHHQSIGSPPKSTFLQAIKNHPKQWHTFPGLTYELISQHLPPSTATYKGHMIRTRQGARSTRNNRQEVLDARLDITYMFPSEQVCSAEEDELFCFAVLGDQNTTQSTAT